MMFASSLRWRVMVAFIALLAISMGVLSIFLSTYTRKVYLNDFQTNLIAENTILAEQVTPILVAGPPYNGLNKIVTQFSKALNRRITIIDSTGLVIGESQYNLLEMENHIFRPEIQQSLTNPYGSEIRFSETLKTDMLYVASAVRNNGSVVGFTRIASSLQQIQVHLRIMQNVILLGTVVAIIFAIILAIFITNRTILPLSRLTDSVIKYRQGNIKEISHHTQMDEVGKLDRAFSELSNQLNNQIEELQNERGKIAAVLTHMTDGIILVNSDSTVELINPAAEDFFNIRMNEAIGRTLTEVVRNHVIVNLWQKTIKTDLQQTDFVETSPERLYLQGFAIPLKNEMFGKTLMIFQDLTRTRRLEIVRQDFISNVSHELRTPLASLKLLTETLRESAMDDPPAANRFLTRMEDEIDNLTQMVRELLELSRIESGRVPLERRPISPRDLLKSSVERMQIQVERAGLHMNFDVSENLPLVYADPDRISQVLVNLIHNAIKFTEPGGLISVCAYQENRQVVFCIQDSGVGIPPLELERIFERFYKADRSRSGGGTGLGLSIARHLVEAHNGKIWANSQPGEGSTFFFSLPVI